MLNKVLDLVRRYEMLQSGDTVTCAVSGGADSMALLWAMYLLKEKLQIDLRAAHFNHRLRGEESDRDEAFVRNFCAFHDIPLTVGAATVVPGKKGLEAAARDARYGFLKTLPGKIATAHTADDNAETVLMHLVRGTGLKGLGAIAPVSEKLIRPMLTVTRQEVLDFLQENHISFVEDSSNGTDAFLRNRIRHDVMPLLKRENPRLAENLSAMAMELRLDAQALEQQESLPDVETLRQMDSPKRHRLLRKFLVDCGVKEPDRRHTALAEELVFSDKPSASAQFPGGIKVRRCYGRLEKAEEAAPIQPVEIPYPGVTELPHLGLRITCTRTEETVAEPDRFTVNPQGVLTLRSRQTPDTIRLPGGTKTLKKLFIDRKIPRWQRPQIPVLADDAGVVGIPGIGVNRDRSCPGIQIQVEKITITER